MPRKIERKRNVATIKIAAQLFHGLHCDSSVTDPCAEYCFDKAAEFINEAIEQFGTDAAYAAIMGD